MLFAALAFATSAVAQAASNRNVSLNWVRAPGADGCTSAKSVAQRVQSYFQSDQLLSEEQFQFVSSSSAHVAIEAHVTPFEDGWQVAISMSRGNERMAGTEFVQRSRSCDELEVQAALVISQLLDSPTFAHAAEEEAQAPPHVLVAYSTELEQTASGAELLPPRAVEQAAPRAEESTRLRLLLGATIDRGMFPGSGFGARAGVALEPPFVFPIELHLAFGTSDSESQFPNERPGVTAGAAAVLNAGAISVLGCPASWEAAWFGVGACAGLQGTAVNARLRDFRNDDAAWVSWLGLAVAVRPTVALSTVLGVWLEGSASFTLLSSNDFVAEVSDSEPDRLTLYSAPQQTAQLALGLSLLL
jgi:hypothetical protein